MAATVEADPKPLENIPEKPLASAAPRLQSTVSELQRYDSRVKHKPSMEFLQEGVTEGQDAEEKEGSEEQVQAVLQCFPLSTNTSVEIVRGTESNDAINLLKETIRAGQLA